MKAYEIFKEIRPETASSVFQYLRDEQRDVYTASLSTLATNRRLRPVFIQRKPGSAQIEWLVKNIRLKTSEEVAEHVIQLWLMKAHREMLTEFLDGVGIEHDGEGAAEEIPDEIDEKKLKKSVTGLLKDHDAEAVRIYLHVFQMQRPDGWTELTALIGSTPELQFGEKEPSTSPAGETPKTGTPADEPADTPADEPADTPADEPADTPADEPADANAEKSSGEEE